MAALQRSLCSLIGYYWIRSLCLTDNHNAQLSTNVDCMRWTKKNRWKLHNCLTANTKTTQQPKKASCRYYVGGTQCYYNSPCTRELWFNLNAVGGTRVKHSRTPTWWHYHIQIYVCTFGKQRKTFTWRLGVSAQSVQSNEWHFSVWINQISPTVSRKTANLERICQVCALVCRLIRFVKLNWQNWKMSSLFGAMQYASQIQLNYRCSRKCETQTKSDRHSVAL